ncbi:hypothetical protein GCM10007977_077660 [Dactylosporangium sucinum]|uniref:Leucine-binding protein domain-containing protein n=1 Tax=Dactylosporangium sucinum TaxID=1424081 RepID=A0A917U7W3_9ACTN|nr:hypothetical protein GCM10007977_077660 [Dactylosporangium sucinum]
MLLDQHLAEVERSHRDGLAAGLDAAGLDRPYELVVAQTDALPAGTSKSLREGFERLRDAGVVAIVGPAVTDNCLLSRVLADRAELPLLNWSGHEQTRSRYSFHYQVGSLEEEPALIVDRLVAQGRTHVALVFDRSEIGASYLRWFERRAQPAGVTVAGRAGISPTTQDTTKEVQELRATGVDTLVYLGLGHSAVAVASALRAGGWQPQVFTNTALMYGHMHPERRPMWEGWVYVDMYADDNLVLRELRERDPQPWQDNPIGICSYDMGRLLGEALRLAPHLNPDGVLEGLQQVKQVPAAAGHGGTTMTFGSWDRAALKGDYLVSRVWRGGRSEQA